MSKVSVIIPTHNRAEFLRSAITSVLNQTYQNFEIIVVDDASTDKTREIITSFDDQRIKYIRHEVNKGDAGSRNTGILNSSSDYLAFLDDDDQWLPEKLQTQMDLLINSATDVGGVFTGTLRIDGATGKISETRIPERGINSFEAIFGFTDNVITTSSILLKRVCFEKVGLFDETMPCSSDYDMWVRISQDFKLQCIKKPFVRYFVHANRLTHAYLKVIQGFEILTRKYARFFAANPKSYSHLYLSLGILYCYNRELREGRRALIKAIKIYPFEIRHYFNLCLSLFGADNFKKIKEVKENLTSKLRSNYQLRSSRTDFASMKEDDESRLRP